MKRRRRKQDCGKVRAAVNLSALYPADPLNDPPRRKRRLAVQGNCAGNHCEKQAVREALDGWRWI